MGKFHQFLTELSAHQMFVFLFPDDNLSKYQWIFTKFGMYIYIMEIRFGIVSFWQLSAHYRMGYYYFMF